MSSIGTGYDLAVTSYSPEGRLFQIEYAGKASKNSGTVIGICCKDGVVVGVENILSNTLLERETNSRFVIVDKHIGMASSGWKPDAKALCDVAKYEARDYKNFYGENIPLRELNSRVADEVHTYTMYWSFRPFGCANILFGMNPVDGPELFMVDPSGKAWGYHAIAIGKGTQQARSELEKLKISEMTCKDAVKEIARIIHKVHDKVKDRDFEFEVKWVCVETKAIVKDVPEEIKKDAVKYALDLLKEEEEEEDESDEDDKMKDEK